VTLRGNKTTGREKRLFHQVARFTRNVTAGEGGGRKKKTAKRVDVIERNAAD